MSDKTIYLLDSNIFIQAHRRYYPFDVVPSFWKALINKAQKGVVKSIDKVKIELIDNAGDGDLLKEWCTKNLPDNFFIDSSSSIGSYSSITRWASRPGQEYTTRAISKFLATDYADPWLISLAHSNPVYKIVTEEISAPNIKREVKIPEVCNYFNVEYGNTIDLLRKLEIVI